MAEKINIGITPMDNTGDKLRTAFSKINSNLFEFKSVTTNTTLTNLDYIVVCEAPIAVLLPPAVDYPNKRYIIKNLDPGLGSVDIKPDNTDLIDFTPTLTLLTEESVEIISNGVKWIKI